MRPFIILGGGGQLGSEIAATLGERCRAFGRDELNICDAVGLASALNTLQPRTVINCAASVNVDAAEDDPDGAFAVNALGARNVALACRDMNFDLIHISTSYVFSGRADIPYDEEATPAPLNVYGTSKLAGEHFVLAASKEFKVVRTSGLYGLRGSRAKGPGRGNFVAAIISAALRGETLRVVSDELITPTYARDFASKLEQILESERGGIYHATNSGSTSWFHFALEIIRRLNLGAEVIPVRARDYGARALRPRNAVLDHATFRKVGIAPLPPWQDALRRYLSEAPVLLAEPI